MKKFFVVLIMLALTSALFANSVTSTTVYDPDAENLKETIATSIVIGPVTLSNTFYLTSLLAEEKAFSWGSAISYAVNDAITVGLKSGYGIASDIATVTADNVPLVLTGAWKVADFFSVSLNYTNDNLTPPEGTDVEIGTFTLGATFTF